MNKVNFKQKLALFDENWTPKVVAQMNNYQFKLVKLSGEFVWHAHQDTDETFICIKGNLKIAMPNTTITLNPGELFVVPKGVKHKPIAEEECHVMIIEPTGVVNTGKEHSVLTAENDVWI